MPLSLLPDPPELTAESLVVLADLASTTTGARHCKRVMTLLNHGSVTNPPRPLRALVAAQPALATLRPTTGGTGYRVEITDEGRAFHRSLMAMLASYAPQATQAARIESRIDAASAILASR